MRPQNTSTVMELSKIVSMVHKLYRPSGGPLYLWYIRCTAHHGGVKSIYKFFFLIVDKSS